MTNTELHTHTHQLEQDEWFEEVAHTQSPWTTGGTPQGARRRAVERSQHFSGTPIEGYHISSSFHRFRPLGGFASFSRQCLHTSRGAQKRKKYPSRTKERQLDQVVSLRRTLVTSEDALFVCEMSTYPIFVYSQLTQFSRQLSVSTSANLLVVCGLRWGAFLSRGRARLKRFTFPICRR